MKKLILILTVFISLTAAQGQTNVYHSFPDSAIWRVDYRSYQPSPYAYFVMYYFQYSITGDTLINSNVYKKIFKSYDVVNVTTWDLPTDPPTSTAAHYVGALRDDSLLNKTFFVFPNESTDSLLYDYNLSVGDSMKGFISETPITVSSMDSILINGQYRNRWFFHQWNDSTYIIEGIGSLQGLIEPIGWNYSVDFTDRYLICVKDNSNTIFTSGYNSAWDCNLIYVGLNEINSDNNFNCYPNPFTTESTIQTDKGFKNATLTVYNSFGQQVKQFDNISGQTITLHRDNLTSGMYFFRFLQDDKVLGTGKLIIADK